MAWLEAVAAFSVVMMVFSTLATITLETLHRIFGVRAKGLRRLSKVMYKDVLKPHLGAKLKTDSSRQFLTAITQMNGAQLTSDAARTHKASSSVTSFLVDGNKLSSLSTLGFIERLARTTEGRTLFLEGQRRGEAYLNSVIQDIAGNYEALGDNARQYFQRRSRLFSCLIGIVLAFSINLDVVHLFTTLLADESVRAQLIEQGDSVKQDLQEALAALDKAIADKELDQDANIDRIRENADKLAASSSLVAAQAIPIGPDTRPAFAAITGCGNILPELKICWRNIGKDIALLFSADGAQWFFSVLTGGLLIGLGGPFWYDLFNKVSTLVATARNPQSVVQQEKERADTSLAAGIPVQAPDVLRVFRSAAGMSLKTGYKSGRATLHDDGSIYGATQ